jgi:3-oxoacyl-[acyl-carrier protein] reductase
MTVDLGLKDKVALITGGTNGLGLRTARAFAKEGAHVSVCSIDPEDVIKKVETELKTYGVTASALKANVCIPDQAEFVVSETVKRFGGIDILINNVGKRFGDSLFQATEEDWYKTYDSIIFQAIRMIKLVTPEMKKREGGSIVNISSVSGWLPQLAKGSQYSSSKAALIFLAEPLALELSHENIRVNTISPGSMISPDGVWEKWRQQHPEDFEIYVRDGFPMGHLGYPEDIADVVVFVASPRAHWINGRHIPVDGLQQPNPAPGYKSW